MPQSNSTVAADVRVADVVAVAELGGELVGELDARDDRRPGAPRDGHGVAEVVRVAVGERGSRPPRPRPRPRRPSGCPSGTGRRATVVPPSESAKAAWPRKRMSMVCQVSCGSGSDAAARRSSRASSSPTATPTSMPSRVSSATSVAHDALTLRRRPPRARPRAPGPRGPTRTSRLRAAPTSSTRCRPRRRVGDDLLRVGEALGVAERGDRGVDLLGGVALGVGVGHEPGVPGH